MQGQETEERIVLRLIRIILGIPQPLISLDQALALARAECERNGWKWGTPQATEGLKHWRVWADRESRPSAFVIINQANGEILQSGCGQR